MENSAVRQCSSSLLQRGNRKHHKFTFQNLQKLRAHQCQVLELVRTGERPGKSQQSFLTQRVWWKSVQSGDKAESSAVFFPDSKTLSRMGGSSGWP